MHFQYYEMSYGLNVEMHKQTEICKRLDAIIRQVLPFLNGEHQQQVAVAIERAKQINITELQALIQVIYNIVCHPALQHRLTCLNRLLTAYLKRITITYHLPSVSTNMTAAHHYCMSPPAPATT